MGSKGKQVEAKVQAKEKNLENAGRGGKDVELLFFHLIEWSFDELLDLYNDYMSLYAIFDDFRCKIKANLVMSVMKAKYKEEVNVT